MSPGEQFMDDPSVRAGRRQTEKTYRIYLFHFIDLFIFKQYITKKCCNIVVMYITKKYCELIKTAAEIFLL